MSTLTDKRLLRWLAVITVLVGLILGGSRWVQLGFAEEEPERILEIFIPGPTAKFDAQSPLIEMVSPPTTRCISTVEKTYMKNGLPHPLVIFQSPKKKKLPVKGFISSWFRPNPANES